MENENLNNQDFIEKISTFIKKKKGIFLTILILIIVGLSTLIFFDSYKEKRNIRISEKYIKAGIFLKNDNKNESLKLYKEIVSSKNKFYSLLALNNIIENNIENNSEEVLRLFTIVENIKYDKNEKDLVKLKKSLYLMKMSKEKEANRLLEEIISSNSIWKEIALKIKK